MTGGSRSKIKSLDLVDPALLAAIESVPPLQISDESLSAIRRAWDALVVPPLPPPAPAVAIRTIAGPPDNPELKVVIVDPKPGSKGRSVFLHMHGGGFVICSALQFAPVLQGWAEACGCVIVSVDYRLAPETRFPGALDDNYAALRWLHLNADELGIDIRRIVVGGDSAGGGHAVMLSLAARDRAEFSIAYQWLVYPMLDDRTGSSRAVSPSIGEFIWTAPQNAFGWSALLGVPAGSETVPDGAVPARLDDLSGLPPTYIGVGALDLFVDEDIAFAGRLIAAGVPVDLDVVAGAYHGFNSIVPCADISIRFNARILEMLKRGLESGQYSRD